MNYERHECRRKLPGRCRVHGSAFFALIIICAVSSAVQGQVSQGVSPEVTVRLQRSLTGSIEEKRSALFEIRNMRSADASRLALVALRDSDPMTRATAASSVVFLPSHEAAGALIPLLTDKDEFVRREGAHALGEVGDPTATLPLIRLMQKDKVFEVRTAATDAIGKTGEISAVESLLAVLRSRPREEEEFLRRSAARSVGRIAQIATTGKRRVVTPQNFLPEKYKVFGDDRSSSVTATFSNAIDVLSRVLQSRTEADDTRREAAFALGAIGDERSVGILQRYSSSPDPYLAEICKEALLNIARRYRTPDPSD